MFPSQNFHCLLHSAIFADIAMDKRKLDVLADIEESHALSTKHLKLAAEHQAKTSELIALLKVQLTSTLSKRFCSGRLNPSALFFSRNGSKYDLSHVEVDERNSRATIPATHVALSHTRSAVGRDRYGVRTAAGAQLKLPAISLSCFPAVDIIEHAVEQNDALSQPVDGCYTLFVESPTWQTFSLNEQNELKCLLIEWRIAFASPLPDYRPMCIALVPAA